MYNCEKMFNVYCGVKTFKICIYNRVFSIKKSNICNRTFIGRFIFCFNKCPRSYRLLLLLFRHTCKLYSFFRQLLEEKKRKCSFYHFIQRKTDFIDCVKYSLKQCNCNYTDIAKPAIFEIELDLRQEFPKQYYKGETDIGHEQWNNHLSFYKIKPFST